MTQNILEVLAYSQHPIVINPLLVDFTGDLSSAAMLGQIIYWFSPSKNSRDPKVSIQRNGKLWLAKTHADWWDEVRISKFNAPRKLKQLEKLGVIEVKTFKFEGDPTKHIHLKQDVLSKLLNNMIETMKADCSNRNDSLKKEECKPLEDSVFESPTEGYEQYAHNEQSNMLDSYIGTETTTETTVSSSYSANPATPVTASLDSEPDEQFQGLQQNKEGGWSFMHTIDALCKAGGFDWTTKEKEIADRALINAINKGTEIGNINHYLSAVIDKYRSNKAKKRGSK